MFPFNHIPTRINGFGLSLTLCLSSAIGVSATPIEQPDGKLVEAEDSPNAAVYANIIQDVNASGGQAVTSPKEWNPLLRYEIEPGDLPARVTVYVRRKHGPVQLKARIDGENKELKWDWGKPDQFGWANLGTYNAGDLGERIEIIRGSGSPAPIADAVVFADADADVTGGKAKASNANTPQNAGDVGITGDAARGSNALPPDRPRVGLTPIEVPFSINWSESQGEITPAHWGVAAYSMVDGKKANEPGYVAFLSTLQPGLVRVHHAGMPNMWSDEASRSWDVEKIRRSLAPMSTMPDAELMVTLCGWPTWFSDSKAIAPEQYDAAEQLVRDWVRAVREASPVPVTHFEIFNEFDNTWEKDGRIDELWPLFSRMVEAARDEASGAQVGGPALTWAKPEWVNGALDAAGSRIDFISWHGYAGGKPTTPNDQVLARASAFAEQAGFVKKQLKARDLSHVDTYLNEYNVQWTWQPYERRHANAIGAALHASIIARLARQDITGLSVWHAKGNAYGLIDEDNRIRATGQLFLLSRPLLNGTISGVSGLDQKKLVEVLPVIDKNGLRSVLLVNLNESPASISDAAVLLGYKRPTDVSPTLHRIDTDGWTTSPATTDEQILLPGWSVTIVTEHATHGRFGTVTLPGQNQNFDF